MRWGRERCLWARKARNEIMKTRKQRKPFPTLAAVGLGTPICSDWHRLEDRRLDGLGRLWLASRLCRANDSHCCTPRSRCLRVGVDEYNDEHKRRSFFLWMRRGGPGHIRGRGLDTGIPAGVHQRGKGGWMDGRVGRSRKFFLEFVSLGVFLGFQVRITQIVYRTRRRGKVGFPIRVVHDLVMGPPLL